MKQFTLLSQNMLFAGHCTTGGSNKVWGACLAHEQEGPDPYPSEPEASTEVVYLCVYGAYGARLRVEPPQRLPFHQAHTLFQKKCREKTGKGYQPIAFASLLPSFVYPDGASLVLAATPTEAVAEDDTALSVLTMSQTPTPLPPSLPLFRYLATPVKAVTWQQAQARLADPGSGLSEKVNGERCLLEFDGTHLVAYNRKGQRVSAPPQGALPLCQPGIPFVLDGERVPGEPTERFIAFDLLEWNAESVLEQPYSARMLHLVRAMERAGLIRAGICTPTMREALANSTVPDLAILATVSGPLRTQEVIAQIQAEGGEGLILRNLAAKYDEASFKYKFLSDLDAFAFAIQEGVAGGSLKLGLVRPADQAIIAIGHVRSGLNTEDMRAIRTMLDQGQLPVFTVQYLPARTTGLHLVEPRTSRRLLRTDKEARECTTDQLDPEKASLIAEAKPVGGRTLQ